MQANSFKTRYMETGEYLSPKEENKLENLKNELLLKVIKNHKEFQLCGHCPFQIYRGRLLLWFNIDDGTTKIITEHIGELN